MTSLEIVKPALFNYNECLHFLSRSDNECMHRVDNGKFYRLFTFEATDYLFSVEDAGASLSIKIYHQKIPDQLKAMILAYVREWLDLDGDLASFYHFAKSDELLAPLCEQYHGLRLIGIPDLFEALAWAIIGQQINLGFAYQMKKNFVEKYGGSLHYQGVEYYSFPSPALVAALQVADLKALQFSRQKAEYLIGIAQLIAEGQLTKTALQMSQAEQIAAQLCSIRGVGNWTAQYVLLKSFLHPNALPLQDAGLHQAIRKLSGMLQKPDIATIRRVTDRWEGWKGYATFYCWHSLLY